MTIMYVIKRLVQIMLIGFIPSQFEYRVPLNPLRGRGGGGGGGVDSVAPLHYCT